MSHQYWPLFDLRLTTGDLELATMTEADLERLAEALPDEVEQDPAATTYPGLSDQDNRAAVVHQTYWRYFGTWSPQAWRLSFVVSHAGEPIGVQELEGNDFPVLRTVDTSSYLVASARAAGLGQQMRRAVLALAFGPLQAQVAVTSAWHDNHASLGVSRALGYRSNGEQAARRGRRVDTMVHMRLTRADWLAGAAADPVAITGFEPCRALFAL